MTSYHLGIQPVSARIMRFGMRTQKPLLNTRVLVLEAHKLDYTAE